MFEAGARTAAPVSLMKKARTIAIALTLDISSEGVNALSNGGQCALFRRGYAHSELIIPAVHYASMITLSALVLAALPKVS
jgi:hypothetical protein